MNSREAIDAIIQRLIAKTGDKGFADKIKQLAGRLLLPLV